MKTIQILGKDFSALSYEETIQTLEKVLLKKRQKLYHVITANPEILMQINRSESLNDIAEKADLLTPDGIGILLGARLLGQKIPDRVTGVDLLQDLIRIAEKQGYPIYLLGAKPQVNDALIKYVKNEYPKLNLAGYHHGYFNPEDNCKIIDEINHNGSKILITALGSPRGLEWFHDNRDTLNVDFVMDVGGGFDSVTGFVKRAPKWIQKIHLEWLYRRLQTPSRKDRQKDLYRYVFAVLKSRKERNHA